MRDTNEIPRDKWDYYLDALSNRQKNQPVRVRIEGDAMGDQTLADCLPLVGISCEKKGSEANAVEITVGNQADDSITHLVHDPDRIYVKEADNGQVSVLDIEKGRVKTLIFFEERTKLPSGR